MRAGMRDHGRITAEARRSRRRLVVTIGAAVFLVPWTVYLGHSLPRDYTARNWNVTWIGFDVILTVMFATTAILALARRQLMILAAFTCGVLLLCDAWFDVTTAGPEDRTWSVALALLAEGPMAALLISGALRRLRLALQALDLLDPSGSLWRARMLPFEAPGDDDPASD